MASTLDIQITPISRRAGQNQPDLPGFTLTQAPRRSARGRTNDSLVLYLELSGLGKGEIDQASLLKTLNNTYYSNPGATSSTLRLLAEDLNSFLVRLNKQNISGNKRVIAALTQVVLRPGGFYMAQSGLAHAFFVTASGVQHLYDPMFTGQGLGSGQTTPVRYYQGQFETGDFLLLSALPSPLWTETSLSVFHGQELDRMRQRLFDQAMAELSAVLLYARPGTGLFQIVPLTFPGEGAIGSPDLETAASSQSKTGLSEDRQVEGLVEPAQDTQTLQEEIKNDAVLAVAIDDREQDGRENSNVSEEETVVSEEDHSKDQSLMGQPVTGKTSQQPEQNSAIVNNDKSVGSRMIDRVEIKSSEKTGNRFTLALVAIRQSFSNFFGLIGRNFSKYMIRLFPDEFLGLSNTVMAVIAILVPLIIVGGASLVYYQLGRAEHGRQLYQQAGNTAINALEMEQPLQQRSELLRALGYLSQVDSYGGVPVIQVDELRFRLQNELDRIDNIRRIDYQPAIINGLDETARISRMLVSFDDLYLLDSNKGIILRAFKTTQGYQLDGNFQCAPQDATNNLGSLVGMVLWEGFDPDARIMAVDQAGNLLFCQPGRQPVSGKLAFPSTGVFRSITTITIDRSFLYVLDPPANAVWVYQIGELDQEPSFFFGDEPPELKDAIDLAVNFDELYLLHKDGHLTLCFAFIQGISSPKCNSPQPFTDFRVGRENAAYISDTPFSQIYSNPAPDPSLYFLEPADQSVTHFSFRTLGYLREYAPLRPLNGGSATSFAINGIDRTMFLALGSQVYFGVMP